MKLKFCQTARLEVCYRLEYFFADLKIFRFWQKTMDSIVRGFSRNLCQFLLSHYSKLGGAMKLNVTPFCCS